MEHDREGVDRVVRRIGGGQPRGAQRQDEVDRPLSRLVRSNRRAHDLVARDSGGTGESGGGPPEPGPGRAARSPGARSSDQDPELIGLLRRKQTTSPSGGTVATSGPRSPRRAGGRSRWTRSSRGRPRPAPVHGSAGPGIRPSAAAQTFAMRSGWALVMAARRLHWGHRARWARDHDEGEQHDSGDRCRCRQAGSMDGRSAARSPCAVPGVCGEASRRGARRLAGTSLGASCMKVSRRSRSKRVSLIGTTPRGSAPRRRTPRSARSP